VASERKTEFGYFACEKEAKLSASEVPGVVTGLRLAASATDHGLAAWLHHQAGCSSVTPTPPHIMAHYVQK